MINLKKKTHIITGVLCIFIIVIGVNIFWEKPSVFFQKNTTQIPITFSPKWVNQAQFAGVFVAKDLGFYADNDLDVEIDTFESGDSVLDDLVSGRSQFGLMGANEFLAAYVGGEDIVAVAAFYQTSPYVIASLKSSGIESPSEFRGKVLGVKGGSGAEAASVLDLLLRSAGLSDDDVNFAELPLGPSEYEDLLAERADVVGFYRTRLYQFEKEGLSYNVIYPEQYGSALYNDVLVVTRDYLDNFPDQVEDFIESTVKGWNYSYENIDESVAITLRYVTAPSYLDIDYERFILEQSEGLMKPTGKRFPIGSMQADDWERFYDTLILRGYLEGYQDRPIEEAYSLDFF